MKKLIALAAVLVLAGCSAEPAPVRPAEHPAASASAAGSSSPTPSLESGTAIPGAFCSTEGARRLTKNGEIATCTQNGKRLQWKVAP